LSGAFNINVFIDEELASTLDVSEKATFNVKTGEMFFALQFTGNGLCTNSSIHQLETSIKHGQHKTYRVALDPSGSMAILPSGFYK
jgi:hypothetical protein